MSEIPFPIQQRQYRIIGNSSELNQFQPSQKFDSRLHLNHVENDQDLNIQNNQIEIKLPEIKLPEIRKLNDEIIELKKALDLENRKCQILVKSIQQEQEYRRESNFDRIKLENLVDEKNQEIKECKVLTKMIFSQYQPQFIVNKFKMLLQMRLT